MGERCRELGAAAVHIQPADMGSERDVLELYQVSSPLIRDKEGGLIGDWRRSGRPSPASTTSS